MSHYDRIPDLLDALVLTPEIAKAARAVGITRQTVHDWLIGSRSGKAALQQIEWHGVTAAFHEHYQNAVKLSILDIEAIARDRALNGTMVQARFRGEPTYLRDDRVVKYFGDGEFDADECEVQFGQRDLWLRTENGERIPVMDKIEPSPQLVALILQSHISKYAKHATLDVTHGGILKLGDTATEKPKMIEQQPELVQLEDQSAAPDEKQGGFLAVPTAPENPADIDAMAKAGAFKSQDVTFTKEDGTETIVPGTPPANPADYPNLADKPGDSDQVRSLKAQARELLARAATGPKQQPSAPVQVFKPSDEPPERKQPEQRADQSGIGAGRVLPHGMKMA